MVTGAIDWGQGVEDAWVNVADFVPKFFAFLVILIVGFVIAKVLSKAVDAILERVGFDRAVERGGVGRVLESTKYDPSDIIGKIVFWAIFLIVLQLAFGVFGPNAVSDMLAAVVGYLPQVIVAIIIVVIAAAIAAGAKEIIQGSLGGLSYGRILANVVAVAILTVGAFAAVSQLGIAPAIVNALFWAILAIIVGVAIVAVGGGGIRPMQRRWEQALDRYDREKPLVQNEYRRTRAASGARDHIATQSPNGGAMTSEQPRVR